mgnify:CR=1 FL=1
MRALGFALLTLLALRTGPATAGFANADQDAAAREVEQGLHLAPNLENGRRVYRTCAVCHLPEGWGDESGYYPQIAGQLRADPAARNILFATQGTVDDATHASQLSKLGFSDERLVMQACPQLSLYIEQGFDSMYTEMLIDAYVDEALSKTGDIGGPLSVSFNCTHFGYSLDAWKLAFSSRDVEVDAFLDPFAHPVGVTEGRQLAVRVEKYQYGWCAVEFGMHDQTAPGLVDIAGLAQFDCPGLVFQQAIGIAELEFYHEFHARLNSIAFQYLKEDPKTVLRMLWFGFPVARYLLLCGFLWSLFVGGLLLVMGIAAGYEIIEWWYAVPMVLAFLVVGDLFRRTGFHVRGGFERSRIDAGKGDSRP